MSEVPIGWVLWELHARELLRRDDWQLNSLETLEPYDSVPRYIRLGGGVCAERFKSGPRKGRLNWAKASLKNVVITTDRDHDAWCDAWEKRTGQCKECGETGRVLMRWSKVDGTTFKPCPRCERGKTWTGTVLVPNEAEVAP